MSDYMKEMERLADEYATAVSDGRDDDCIRLRAALLAHAAQAERDAWGWTWQPIETAPKDDSYLLVSNGHGVWVARFKSVYQSGWKPPSPWQSMMLNHDHIPSAKRNGSPTHWMPLPTPPSAALHGTMEGDMRYGLEEKVSEQIIDGMVIPYDGGRKCTDTRAWRDATALELEQAERIAELEARLKEIGDYAHDNSTGPAVPDALWTIREMAYDG